MAIYEETMTPYEPETLAALGITPQEWSDWVNQEGDNFDEAQEKVISFLGEECCEFLLFASDYALQEYVEYRTTGKRWEDGLSDKIIRKANKLALH